MGFATSITTAILFMAIIIIATITYPTLFQSFKNLQESKDDKHEIQKDQLNTAIDIISINAAGNVLQITVTNEETTMLHANRSIVLVDGDYTDYSVNPTGFWSPQNAAVFTVSANTTQNHIIKIITEKGISDMDIYYN